jgi:hypothetical protein
MRSHEASSSETTTCENFLYCYLDKRVGVEEPWGVDLDRVAEIHAAVTKLHPSVQS